MKLQMDIPAPRMTPPFFRRLTRFVCLPVLLNVYLFASGARACRETPEELCRRAAEHFQEGELASALDVYTEAMSAARRNPCGYLGAARVYRRLDDQERSLTVLKEGLGEFPDSVSLRLDLAALCVDLQQFETAAKHYERVVAGRERVVPALVGLGILHSKKGALALAKEKLREALAVDPRSLPAQYNLGLVVSREGDVPAALEELRKALAIDGERAMVHYAYAGCLEREGRLEDAHAALRRAVELEPSLAPAHYRLGKVCLRLGKTRDGHAALRRFRQLKARTHFQRGEVLSRRKDRRGAIRAFERSIDAYPALVDAHVRLGLLYLEDREGARALLHSRRAAQFDPTGAHLSNVAWVYFNVGKRQEALAWIDRALKKEPDRKEFLDLRRRILGK